MAARAHCGWSALLQVATRESHRARRCLCYPTFFLFLSYQSRTLAERRCQCYLTLFRFSCPDQSRTLAESVLFHARMVPSTLWGTAQSSAVGLNSSIGIFRHKQIQATLSSLSRATFSVFLLVQRIPRFLPHPPLLLSNILLSHVFLFSLPSLLLITSPLASTPSRAYRRFIYDHGGGQCLRVHIS